MKSKNIIIRNPILSFKDAHSDSITALTFCHSSADLIFTASLD